MINIVKIYTTKGCRPCIMTKNLMDRLGIEYKEVPQDTYFEADDQAIVSLYKSYPVVIAGNKHWSGFKPNNIRKLVEEVVNEK